MRGVYFFGQQHPLFSRCSHLGSLHSWDINLMLQRYAAYYFSRTSDLSVTVLFPPSAFVIIIYIFFCVNLYECGYYKWSFFLKTLLAGLHLSCSV